MDLNEIKKKYSYAGLSYFAFMVLTWILQVCTMLVLKKMGIERHDWIMYLSSMIPMWAVSFPVCVLMMRKLPTVKTGDEKYGALKLLQVYPMVLFMVISGSVIGNILSFIIGFLTNSEVKNTTIDAIQGQAILPSFVFACIVAPVMEELAFRKLLIDKLGHYSKKYTIILSGVMFGLAHANLYQFFYACALGSVFVYFYTKTGRIHYTMILHGIINFMHGVFPMIFLKNLDMEALQNASKLDISSQENIQAILNLYSDPNFLMLLLWLFIIFCLLVLGIVLFILNVKKVRIDDTASPLQKPFALKTVFLNVGIILFILETLTDSIYQIVCQIKA